MNMDRYKTPLPPRGAGAASASTSTVGGFGLGTRTGTGTGLATSSRTRLDRATTTPATTTTGPSLRATAIKRDTLAAELERDPHLSSSKRHQRTQAFTSSTHLASLERQLLAAQTAKTEVETRLRERELQVERLEADRRWLAEREREEREERERERGVYEEFKRTSEAETRTLRTSLSALRDELADLQDAHTLLSRSAASAASAHQGTVSALRHENALLESELAEARRRAEERKREVEDLRKEYEAVPKRVPRQKRERRSPAEGTPDDNGNDKEEEPAAEAAAEVEVEEVEAAEEDQKSKDLSILTHELSNITTYLRALESAHAKLQAETSVLRAQRESVEVLKEEKRGLEERVRGVEEMRRRVVRLEALLGEERERRGEVERALEAERKGEEGGGDVSFASQSTSPSTSTSPASLIQTLSALRLAHAQLLEEHGTTRALLAQRSAELSASTQRAAELEREVGRLERAVGEERGGRERRDVRVRVLEREVGFLGALVASYNAEAAQAQPSSEQPQPQLPQLQPQLQQRIQQLEALLAEYKTVNDRLQAELDALVGVDVGTGAGVGGESREEGQRTGVKTLLGQLEEVKNENAALKENLTKTTSAHSTTLAQLEAISQQLFDLQGEVAGGRHVPPHTRVLSLRENPESRWFGSREAVLERLRRENGALLRRLRDVEVLLGRGGGGGGDVGGGTGAGGNEGEKGGEEEEGMDETRVLGQEARVGGGASDTGPPTQAQGGAGELVPRESWEIVNQEKSELEELLKQKEKRLLRLQQVYQSKSAEFREAIASLLGLKLAFYPNGQVRVTSIYDLCASFVFQPSRSSGQGQGGTMQLVAQGEGGPQELPDLMRYWIESEQCIPGFLASVTLECYDKVKRGGGGGGGGGGEGVVQG